MAQALSTAEPVRNLFDDDERKKLAQLVIRLFDKWQLSTDQRLNLLGLSPSSRAVLGKYKAGGSLPPSRDVLDRVGWLMGIHKALRLLYPQNEAIRYTWVRRRNAVFENKTPLEVMMEEGLLGVARVARCLDHFRGL